MKNKKYPLKPTYFILLTLLAWTASTGGCLGEILVTIKGKTYQDVVVTEETPTHVKFRHTDGIARISKSEIAAESFKTLGLEGTPVMASDSQPERDLVAEIKGKMAEIRTRDGRIFKTQDLREVEPNGLKFFGESGVAKVKFTELPQQVLGVIGWDASKAAEYEDKMAREQAANDRKRREYDKANSILESAQFDAKIKPIQRVNAGWLCMVSERRKVTANVVADTRYNALSGAKTIVAETKEFDVSGPAELALVWGLSDRVVHGNQQAVMSTRLYLTGKYRYGGIGGDAKEAIILHSDRPAALKHLMQFGLTVVHDEDMAPEQGGGGALVAFGSGFFISKDGHIATNNHVIEGAKKVMVTSAGQTRTATVVAVDEGKDIALLKVDHMPATHLRLADHMVKLGDRVFTVGFPRPTSQGKNAKFTEGSVSSLTGLEDDGDQMQISVPIQPGNSGGPLVNGEGRVVGVIVATLNHAHTLASSKSLPQNVNFAVKADHLSKLCQKAGVTLDSSTPPLAAPVLPTQPVKSGWGDHIQNTEKAAVLIRVEG